MENNTLSLGFCFLLTLLLPLGEIDGQCGQKSAWAEATQTGASPQRVSQAWVRRYNGAGNGSDEALAMAVDKQGNIIVTGYSTGSGTDWDFCTIKYTSDGQQLWIQRYNGPGNGSDRAQAIAVDDQSHVYVAGYSLGSSGEYTCTTIKYSPTGQQLWVRRDHTGHATSIAVDAQNNVYVAVLGFITVKYSPDGQKLWTRDCSSLGSSAGYNAIAVDNLGNAYVSGTSHGYVTAEDYTTIKYSPTGKLLWMRRYNGPMYYQDYLRAMAVDSQGNVYVTGSTPIFLDEFYFDTDYATIKYSPTGQPLWLRFYNGPATHAYDNPSAIAVDSKGNVYVTGSSGGIGTGPDYATLKYSPTGQQLWVRRYNGPGTEYDKTDYATALAADAQGNIYVAGFSDGAGSSWDYATIKYSPTGQQLWLRRYNGTGNSQDVAKAIAVDNQGNVYVTGRSYGSGTGLDYLTIKYTQQ
jgi:uncharacterized delta-60 repeat protein